MRCLGRLVVLSQPLCYQHLPILEACLASTRATAIRAAAAVAVAGQRKASSLMSLIRSVETVCIPRSFGGLRVVRCFHRPASNYRSICPVGADVVDAFPTAFGSKLGLVGSLVVEQGGCSRVSLRTADGLLSASQSSACMACKLIERRSAPPRTPLQRD